MPGSYLLYNELHYNGLMTDLGLIPSLYHLEEHSLQEHTLLHLCVIVSNLAEMFFVVILAKRLYSLLFLPSFLLLAFFARACAHYRSFVFCCHKCHSRWSWQHFLIPQNNVSFVENNVSFYWKRRVVLLKTTCRFIENNVSFCAGQRLIVSHRCDTCDSKKMKTPVLRVRVTCVRARKSFGKNGGGTPNNVAPKCQSCFGENYIKKGDANRVGQALCFLLLLSNLSDS